MPRSERTAPGTRRPRLATQATPPGAAAPSGRGRRRTPAAGPTGGK